MKPIKSVRKKLFYIHGGPGFNSVAERNLLASKLSDRGFDAYFWNEVPSAGYSALLRQLLDSFAAQSWSSVHVVAHSFGCFLARDLLGSELSSRIEKLSLVCPSPNLYSAHLRILSLALKDFESSEENRSLADMLRQKIALTRSFFDSSLKESIQIATQDPLLLTHYWKNALAMQRYFDIWQAEGLRLDLDSFNRIMEELKISPALRENKPNARKVRTQIIQGKWDPVSAPIEQAPALREWFPEAEVQTFETSAHFAHLEEIESFLNSLSF